MDQSTCDLCDAFGDAGRVVAPVFRHFGGKRRFSGEVVTVQCFEDNSRVKELVRTSGAGRVLVVDGGASTRCALLGDAIAKEAMEHGWAGAVVHGCVRDTAVLATLDFGVLALAAMPRRSRKNGEGEVGGRVDLAGTACMPGDVLFADEDGIFLIEPSVLSRAADPGTR